MRIVNIIEVKDNMIMNILSFSIIDEQLSGVVFCEAQKEFEDILLKNGAEPELIEQYLDDGFFRKEDYSATITFSYIDY